MQYLLDGQRPEGQGSCTVNERETAPDGDALALRSVGALAYVTAELDALQIQLEALPQWRPARPLLAELAWARRKLSK